MALPLEHSQGQAAAQAPTWAQTTGTSSSASCCADRLPAGAQRGPLLCSLPPATSFCLLCAKGSLPSLLGLDLPRGAGSQGVEFKSQNEHHRVGGPGRGPAAQLGFLVPDGTVATSVPAGPGGVSLGGSGPTGPPPWPEEPGPLSLGHVEAGVRTAVLLWSLREHPSRLSSFRSCLLRGPWLLASSSRPALVTAPLPAFLSCGPGGGTGPTWKVQGHPHLPASSRLPSPFAV